MLFWFRPDLAIEAIDTRLFYLSFCSLLLINYSRAYLGV